MVIVCFIVTAIFNRMKASALRSVFDDDVTATPAHKHPSDRPKKQAERKAL